MKVYLIPLFLILRVNSQDLDEDPENLIVKTENGKVRGRSTQTLVHKKEYFAFQGIPYARPPLDELRFRAPLPAEKWEGVLETNADEKRCIQDLTRGSEDCLYINVFTPKLNESLAVMIWIYGGYFFEGDSKQEHFGPDYLIEEDVIVVTFNYRLGIFGFLSTQDSAAPGNYGLKDQILALKWVQSNIARFGGDPSKVTIFGESAGAASVSYLLQTPLTKDLFQGAIMQSGTTLNPWALSRNPKSTAEFIGTVLDVNTTSTRTLVNALRRIDPKVLQAVAFSSNLRILVANPLDTVIFGPTIEPNIRGAVVTKRSHELLKNGDFRKVPCIVGFNSEEGLPLKNFMEFVRPYLISFDLISLRLVPADMNIENIFQKATVGVLIRQKYFKLLPLIISDQKVIRFITDDVFVRSIHEYVSILSKFNPVYFYKFSYEGGLGLNGGKRSYKGVGHNEDLKYLWEKKAITVEPSFSDEITRKRLVTLWTNFAKFRNPTPVKDLLFQNVIWPLSTYSNVTYLDIGNVFKLASNFDNYNIPFWKELYKNNGYPPFDTY